MNGYSLGQRETDEVVRRCDILRFSEPYSPAKFRWGLYRIKPDVPDRFSTSLGQA